MSLVKSVFILVVAIASASAEPSSPIVKASVGGRIIGGVNARNGEFPHICAIELIRTILPPSHIGAANILNSQWVLTTAAIVGPPPILSRYEVICGRSNLGLPFEVTEQRLRINTIIRHPEHNNSPISAFDIALINLQAQLHFSPAVQPISLPVDGATPTGIGSLIGWGGTDEAWIGQSFGMLQLSRVAILMPGVCTPFLNLWGLSTTANHFCSGPITGGLSPCTEDAGSSIIQTIVSNNILLGLVSLPQPCGRAGEPGTFVRVSAFIGWILQNMN